MTIEWEDTGQWTAIWVLEQNLTTNTFTGDNLLKQMEIHSELPVNEFHWVIIRNSQAMSISNKLGIHKANKIWVQKDKRRKLNKKY